jgi:hypothetical protein
MVNQQASRCKGDGTSKGARSSQPWLLLPKRKLATHISPTLDIKPLQAQAAARGSLSVPATDAAAASTGEVSLRAR